MGILSRSVPHQRALVAAARRIDLADAKAVEKSRKRRAAAWQQEAWNYFDEVGEIKYALTLKAEAISRIRVFPAVQIDPNEDPVPIADLGSEDVPDLAVIQRAGEAAQVALDRLRQAEGGMGGLLHEFSVNLDVPGECYLVGRRTEDGETFDVKSIDEVEVEHGRHRVRSEPGGQAEDLTPDDFFMRVWRRHPRFSELADSNMRSVLAECEELLILSRMIRAQAKSRLQAGVLFVPTELSFGAADPTQDAGDGEEGDDPFANALMEAMTEPIHDEGSASAVVPLMVRGPAELGEAIRHITLDRQVDQQALEQRKELLRRIGNGLNLPVEKMLGMESVNHWTGWLIDENFNACVRPSVMLICDGLTVGYLRPSLTTEEVGIDPQTARLIRFWFDATNIVIRPNLTEDIRKAHEAFVASDDAYRGAVGLSEADAPDEEEVQRRIAIVSARKGSAQVPTIPTETDERGPAQSPLPGEEDEVQTGASLSLVAAGPRRLDGLAERLAELDRMLLERLLLASDSALNDALSVAGARARSAASRNTEARGLLAGVPASQVTQRLGEAFVAALGLSDEAMLADAFEDLHGRYDEWVTRAQRVALDHVREEAGQELSDRSAREAEQDDDRREGWALLLAALLALAKERLFSPEVSAPPIGEFDPSTSVPPGMIRKALQRAGGARVYDEIEGSLVVGNRPVGGVATGEMIRDLIVQALRASFGGWKWVYGDPSLRKTSFEPHRSLNGVEFGTWQDDVLVNAQAWPPVSHYSPGDHAHCRCTFVPVIEARMAEAA